MPEIFSVIHSEGINLANNIRINMGRAGMNATNKTGNSLRPETKKEGTKITMQLFGRPFFMTVQTGRGPTKPGAALNDPSLVDAITEWLSAKGISGNPWAIAESIHKNGTKLWRDGGRTDIVDPAVDTFVNDVSQAVLEAEADNFVLKLRQMKW